MPNSPRRRQRMLLLLPATVIAAQALYAQPADTLKYQMDEIVVTADRAESQVASTIGSLSWLSLKQTEARPTANFAGLLETLPGITFLNRDGSGNDPIPVVRGFYGGGEVEYVVVLVDGTPVNQVESGLVNWDALLTENVESVEMLRGGASALYGDAAIGATINVRTANPGSRAISSNLSGGSYGTFNASAGVRNAVAGRRSDLAVDFRRTDGFRDHGKRSTLNANVRVGLLTGDTHKLDLRSENHYRDIESPGYLPADLVAEDPTQSLLAFQSDGTKENVNRLVADGRVTGAHSDDWEFHYSAEGDYRNADIVSTLLLTPQFSDSKQRELETVRFGGSGQYIRNWHSGDVSGRVQIGADVARGSARSDYYNLAPPMGGQGSDDPEKLGLDESGDSHRTTAAGYLQLQIVPFENLLVSAGGRVDHIADSFEPLKQGVVEASSIDHTAFSPKVGLNYGYAIANAGGNAYASVSRSFKAPTLDQLYDQRTIPVQFPPYKISLSNGQLVPQKSTQYEVGLYQRAPLSPSVGAELHAAAYWIDLVNELDFSLEEFRYVNIGESRHKGVEAGLKVFSGRTNVGVSYAYQDAHKTIGETAGNQLKAIPLHMYSADLESGFSDLIFGASATGASSIYLDDANTIPLDGYVTVDARVGYRVGSLTLSVDVFNLLDEQYSTTGFPDPSGGPDIYLYPAAGRRFQAGLTVHL